MVFLPRIHIEVVEVKISPCFLVIFIAKGRISCCILLYVKRWLKVDKFETQHQNMLYYSMAMDNLNNSKETTQKTITALMVAP